MVDYKEDAKPKHPIGVASTRTGIAQDVLRAWERRYGAVVPQRTPTGRRLYTDGDLVRLSLLRRLVEAGRRISDIAGATTKDLGVMAEEDRRAMGMQEKDQTRSSVEPASHLDAAIHAVRKMNRTRLEAVLNDAALSMSVPELRTKVIVPLLHEIGNLWRRGNLRVIHEHLASTIVRKFVEGMRDRSDKNSRPTIIVATPAGQRHEFGAIMAAAAAEEIGWEAVYVGADLPGEEIAFAARRFGVRAVALSLVYKGDGRNLLEELAAIKRSLDPGVTVIVGGRAAAGVRSLLEDLGIMLTNDFGEFQARLESILEAGGHR